MRIDVKPVEQILPEAARRRLRPHVAIGRAHHPTSTLRLNVSPTRRTSCCCRTRSSFACARGDEAGDFVEKERAAVGIFEQPGTVGDRAGKCAAGVPEQLRFEQVVGERRAVDVAEPPLAPRTQLWIARATSSFPTPLSPSIRTENGAGPRESPLGALRRSRRSHPTSSGIDVDATATSLRRGLHGVDPRRGDRRCQFQHLAGLCRRHPIDWPPRAQGRRATAKTQPNRHAQFAAPALVSGPIAIPASRTRGPSARGNPDPYSRSLSPARRPMNTVRCGWSAATRPRTHHLRDRVTIDLVLLNDRDHRRGDTASGSLPMRSGGLVGHSVETMTDRVAEQRRRGRLHATEIRQLAVSLMRSTGPAIHVIQQQAEPAQTEWCPRILRRLMQMPHALLDGREDRRRPSGRAYGLTARSRASVPDSGARQPQDSRPAKPTESSRSRARCPAANTSPVASATRTEVPITYAVVSGSAPEQARSRCDASSIRPCQSRTRASVASARARSSPASAPVRSDARHSDSAAVNCPASVRAAACQTRAPSDNVSSEADCAYPAASANAWSASTGRPRSSRRRPSEISACAPAPRPVAVRARPRHREVTAPRPHDARCS